ncbi:MAG: hypothetical protein AB7P69_00945 [Candidatus Binatia bacterium]
MFVQPPSFSAVPTSVVDLTYDFAPLFLGLVIGLCLCVLALAFAIGIHDTWGFFRQSKQPSERPASVPELPNAA